MSIKWLLSRLERNWLDLLFVENDELDDNVDPDPVGNAVSSKLSIKTNFSSHFSIHLVKKIQITKKLILK